MKHYSRVKFHPHEPLWLYNHCSSTMFQRNFATVAKTRREAQRRIALTRQPRPWRRTQRWMLTCSQQYACWFSPKPKAMKTNLKTPKVGCWVNLRFLIRLELPPFFSRQNSALGATWIQTWQASAGWRMEMAISHISNSLSTSGVYWKMGRRMLVSWVILSGV